MSLRRLDTDAYARAGGGPRPGRVRLVHLGLGNFHRAHQAWYTAHASDAAEWGIAAFTGRSSARSDLLTVQDGLYHLVVRGPEADALEIIPGILEVYDGADVPALARLLADPQVAVVTLTITEAGYRLDAVGDPDLGDPVVRSDVDLLRTATPGGWAELVPQTTLARLLVGLDARRHAEKAPIALVPCDNVPANGEYLSRGLTALAAAVAPELAAWIAAHVSFVSTSVDRITPRSDGPEPSVVAAGWDDRAPVVTEHFSDWVLCGDFPAGRPRWEDAGARVVDEIEAWENRKLWLLNGAHTILACVGPGRGHTTVAEAIADGVARRLVEDFWDEAVEHLGADVEHGEYRADLLARFANPRMEHRLAQITADATTKVRYRIAAVAELSRRSGRPSGGSAAALAAWIATTGARSTLEGTRDALAVVSSALADDAAFVAAVHAVLTIRPEPHLIPGEPP